MFGVPEAHKAHLVAQAGKIEGFGEGLVVEVPARSARGPEWKGGRFGHRPQDGAGALDVQARPQVNCRDFQNTLCGFFVQAVFAQTQQLVVGVFFLGEGLGAECRRHCVVAELVGPGDERTVAGDLVVLDGLCGGDQGRVLGLGVRDLARAALRLPR